MVFYILQGGEIEPSMLHCTENSSSKLNITFLTPSIDGIAQSCDDLTRLAAESKQAREQANR